MTFSHLIAASSFVKHYLTMATNHGFFMNQIGQRFQNSFIIVLINQNRNNLIADMLKLMNFIIDFLFSK